MSSISKDINEIRVVSGNEFRVKIGGGWATMGNIVSGKPSHKPETTTVTLGDGKKVKKRTSVECSFEIVLAQFSMKILNKLHELDGTPVELYYFNGNEGGYNQEIYIPSAECILDYEILMAAGEHQKIPVMFAINPVTPGTTLNPSTVLAPMGKCTQNITIPIVNGFFWLLDSQEGNLLT